MTRLSDQHIYDIWVAANKIKNKEIPMTLKDLANYYETSVSTVTRIRDLKYKKYQDIVNEILDEKRSHEKEIQEKKEVRKKANRKMSQLLKRDLLKYLEKNPEKTLKELREEFEPKGLSYSTIRRVYIDFNKEHESKKDTNDKHNEWKEIDFDQFVNMIANALSETFSPILIKILIDNFIKPEKYRELITETIAEINKVKTHDYLFDAVKVFVTGIHVYTLNQKTLEKLFGNSGVENGQK